MPKRRLAILTDGPLEPFAAKTAVGLLRHCPQDVVAVINRDHAGERLADLVGLDSDIPVVADVPAAAALDPNHLAIGIVLPGGQLPDAFRSMIKAALSAGMDILNGLHTRLNEDAELHEAALRTGRTIHDIRVPPAVTSVGSGKARTTRARRVLTVGTDCNLGKRVTALLLTDALRRRGMDVQFLATGQTGVMISGSGVVADAVVSDFLPGAIEKEVLERGEADMLLIEGQGAILHPAFSAVTLGLLHGAMPDAMVLCHAPTRTHMRHTDTPFPPLTEVIGLYESLLRPHHPTGRVVAVSLNTLGLSDEDAEHALRQVATDTGLPVSDPVRFGLDAILPAVRGIHA